MSKSTIDIRVMKDSMDNYYTESVQIMTFPGGEVNIRLPSPFFRRDLVVYVRLKDAAGIMALAQVKEALDYAAPTSRIVLNMAYIPYARQDRRCNTGESLSSKVFANMINAMNFDRVIVTDPHSEASSGMLDRCSVDSQDQLIRSSSTMMTECAKMTLVAPDFGASKKCEKLAQRWERPMIQGYKKRDLKTGTLSGFGFHGNVLDKDLLIVDDICDGGGTFIGLANELYSGGANTVSLYVTHGIFSKGTELLLESGIEKIYTTDSYYQGTNDNVHTINL